MNELVLVPSLEQDLVHCEHLANTGITLAQLFHLALP